MYNRRDTFAANLFFSLWIVKQFSFNVYENEKWLETVQMRVIRTVVCGGSPV